jgi:Family of unknown function (DUF5677)
MSQFATGIGSTESQAVFLRENENFLREHIELGRLESKIFVRALDEPPQEQLEDVRKLPEHDSAVIEFEDKLSCKVIVFYLGRIAADDFGEIVVLAGNGYGFGAHKIVRGMYERVVTAMYVARRPAEARVFAEQSAIDKYKLWERTVGAFPEMVKGVSEQELRLLKESSDAARKKTQSIGVSKLQAAFARCPMDAQGN